MSGDIDIRPLVPDDRPSVLRMLAASLGRDGDPRFEALYRWKHETNPFGPSYVVVATSEAQVVGFRAMMRWRFRWAGRSVVAVRAVDTATHPDHQGRRIFTRLTRRVLELMEADGVGAVFNTPNSQSRPGYLKMGWSEVGRIPIAVQPCSLRSLPRIVHARVPAERWSEPSGAGTSAEDALGDEAAIAHLLATQPADDRLRTDRSPAYLRWRYCGAPLGYRALTPDGDPSDGLLIFRVRRRGAAREVVLDELLVPGGAASGAQALLRRLRREAEGDYVIRAGATAQGATGFVPLPRQGPVLTWKAVTDHRQPALADLALTMGDVELF